MRAPRSLLAGLVAAVALWLPGSAGAQPIIAPGFDLFETDPQTTVFEFRDIGTIPPGFFGPNCDGFTGNVHFGGQPLFDFNGTDVGDADTIVQRLNEAPADGSPIQIELVELSLVSVQPIAVQCNGNVEQWQIHVGPSPSQPSRGQMQVFETGFEGGDFNSQLAVFPEFHFTRLPDGEMRVFDGGQGFQDGSVPPEEAQKLVLHANGVPYANGCQPPALVIPELNDLFCPGFEPETGKVLTIEQAALASHGIFPVQPRLEHFRCYKLKKKPFKAQRVQLADQFTGATGGTKAKVKRRKELCNPVQKRREPFVNRQAHLTCYKVGGRPVEIPVATHNQFGSQLFLVEKPVRLCAASQKKKPKRSFKPVEFPIDHFQCYRIQPESPLLATDAELRADERLRLKDQFRKGRVRVGDPYQLCAPTEKQHRGEFTPILHHVKHLVCYRLKGRARHRAKIRNQFERSGIRTRRERGLCLPSNKLRLDLIDAA